MNLSAEHIQGLAAETGFRAETLEKVVRLSEMAADLVWNVWHRVMPFLRMSARYFLPRLVMEAIRKPLIWYNSCCA